MRIAMVFPDSGAASVVQQHVAALSNSLARQGHRVTIYTNRGAQSLPENELVPDGYDVVYGPPDRGDGVPGAALIHDLGNFTQFLKDQWDLDAPDVAHAHFWTAGLATQLAARGRPVPTVQTFHSLADHVGGSADSGPQSRMRLEALLARGGSWLIASSADQMVQLARMGGTRSRMSIVPYGVDVDLFTPHGPPAPRSERHRILTAGRVAPHKGHDTLIRALRFIPGAELVIVGPCGDAEARRLMALAAESKVDDRVVLYGEVPHAQMPALLRSADVVACLPLRGSFGLVALEAMACGVPVVASAVGGLADTIVDEVTGRLILRSRPRECSEAILAILRDPFARNGLGAVGRDRARSRYSWDRIAETTAGLYDRLVPSGVALDTSVR